MISMFKNRRVKAQVRAHERAHEISQSRAAHPTSKPAPAKGLSEISGGVSTDNTAEFAAIAAVLAKPAEPHV